MPPPSAKAWEGPLSEASIATFLDDEPRLALSNPDQGSSNLSDAIHFPLPNVPHHDTDEFTLRRRHWGPPLRDVTCIRTASGACEVRVAGSLSPDDIHRVIRRYHARFAFCYDAGLRKNATLAGRVEVHFVIDNDGTVISAKAGKSDLADNDVLACVVRGFYGITFPQPPSGIVTVSYPLLFAPTK